MNSINPCKMTEAEQFVLSELFAQNPNLKVIKKEKNYGIFFGPKGFEKKFTFSVTNDIISRSRKEGKKGVRFEVKDNKKLGEGSYGTVYASCDTLFLENGFLRSTNKQKKRVIKVQAFRKGSCELEVFSNFPSHLHAKPNTVSETEVFNVYKYMPGNNLRTLLQEKKLSTEQKLQLILALAKALKNQVFDNGLAHRDIKPENIMVNFQDESSIPEVNIIDFDFSAKIAEKSNQFVGSLPYMAPEIMQCRSHEVKEHDYFCESALDIYSLSKLICELFLKNYLFSSDDEAKLEKLVKGLKQGSCLSKEDIKWVANLGINELSLFQEDTNLSVIHKKRLKLLIQEMGHFDPKKRMTIDKVITTVDTICKERVGHFKNSELRAQLIFLKKSYPVYHILSCYPHLFKVSKLTIERDGKAVSRMLDRLYRGKLNVDLALTEIYEIKKAWDKIEEHNNSSIFRDIIKILKACFDSEIETLCSPGQKFKEKLKKDFLIYIKKHMSDMVNHRDTFVFKRLKAMQALLKFTENNGDLQIDFKELQTTVTKVLSPKFEVDSFYRNEFSKPQAQFFNKRRCPIGDTMVIPPSPVIRCC